MTVAHVPYGAAMPEALRRYYVLLDDGEAVGAAAQFSADAMYAVVPGRDASESEPQLLIRGRDEIGAWFAQRPSRRVDHRVEVCAIDGDVALVEGRIVVNGATVLPFLASASLDGDGLLRRYLAFSCPVVLDAMAHGAAVGIAAEPVAADASDVIDRYFELLDTGDFGGAVECFSPGVVYSHPPYRHTDNAGNDRVTFRGRAELLAGFHARGKQSFRHRLLSRAQVGPHCIFEGAMLDLPDGGSGGFMSSLTLDSEGRIARYLSMYRGPAIPLA